MQNRTVVFVVLLTLFVMAPSPSPGEIPTETIHVTGASHIDLAWKWPYERSKYICKFTFGSALNMMDDYDAAKVGENPVYYAQSNAHAYWWIQTLFPAQFERIRQRVAEGRWEIVGGMWCESDAMLPSGESFCRQFLHGQWYFYDALGTMATVGWLPDSFGYNANLPQFMARSGIENFYFFKLNWNDTNQLGSRLFHWRAPDGSQVLAHLGYGHYNNMATSQKIQSAVNAKQQDEPDQTAVFFPLGIGNHGGGIVRANMIRMLAFADAGYNVRFGRADEFFADLNQDAIDRVIDGEELYFERHRGTYTSRADHKRNMRRLEYMLQNAELYASIAGLLTGRAYPNDCLDEAWRRLMRDQFHDTMAGTCLDRVYTTEVAENLERVESIGGDVLDRSLRSIASSIDTTGHAGTVVAVFNPNGFVASQPVALEGDMAGLGVFDQTGQPVPSQLAADENALLFVAQEVPAWGWRTYSLQPEPYAGQAGYPATPTRLENDNLAVELDAQGHVVSLVNKELEFEFIEPGTRANLLQIYADFVTPFDSWDLGFDKYSDEPTLLETAQSVEVVENGPVRQVIEVRREGQAESYVQRIVLYASGDALDFETRVFDWGRPAHRFLKVAFPTTLVNERKQVSHNIPYGHRTRVLDGSRADWEFVGQKWIDLTETYMDSTAPRAGLALLSRDKYGYDMANDGPGEGLSDGRCNVMRLSLLKSGTSPLNTLPNMGGPVTDRGEFQSAYRLYPHRPQTSLADLYRRGEAFANSFLTMTTDIHPGKLAPAGQELIFDAGSGDVIPTTLKAPHRDAGPRELILRLVEIGGEDQKIAMTCPRWPLLEVQRTDLLERPAAYTATVDESGHVLRTDIGHHAIGTLRIKFGDAIQGCMPVDEYDSIQHDMPDENDDDTDDDTACCG